MNVTVIYGPWLAHKLLTESCRIMVRSHAILASLPLSAALCLSNHDKTGPKRAAASIRHHPPTSIAWEFICIHTTLTLACTPPSQGPRGSRARLCCHRRHRRQKPTQLAPSAPPPLRRRLLSAAAAAPSAIAAATSAGGCGTAAATAVQRS